MKKGNIWVVHKEGNENVVNVFACTADAVDTFIIGHIYYTINSVLFYGIVANILC